MVNEIENRRIRRRPVFVDEDNETEEEIINPQDNIQYSDLENYPLNINWQDLDFSKNDSYEIREKFGLVGVNIYFNILNNPILSSAFKIHKPEKILFFLLDFYFENFEKGNYEALKKLTALLSCFPEHVKIYMLIKEKFILPKECLLIKIILDIKVHYLLNIERLAYKTLTNWLNVSFIFYHEISQDNLIKIYEKINKDRDIINFYTGKMLKNYIKKQTYFWELKKIKNNSKDLLAGLDNHNFCL